MQSALAVCGKIGSGKSSVLRELERMHSWDVVSFGAYIKSLIIDPHPVRETYQALGQELFSSRGPRGLLQDALNYRDPKSSIHLIDGVRHVSVVDAMQRIYSKTIVVFLKVDERTRYERFVARSDTATQVSYGEFQQICNHPIEQGIDEIAGISDVVIDASGEIEQVVGAIENVAMKLVS